MIKIVAIIGEIALENTSKRIDTLIYVATPHRGSKPKLSQNTKMINVYSNADSYLDLANVFLNLGLGRKTIENGENIQLDGLKHSLFNYNRQISYDGWVMKLFDLYVNLIKS